MKNYPITVYVTPKASHLGDTNSGTAYCGANTVGAVTFPLDFDARLMWGEAKGDCRKCGLELKP